MKILPRTAWKALRPKTITYRATDTLKGVAIHYFGIPGMSRSHAGCPALLRGVQHAHQNHPTEHYADIAYGHAVCPHGVAYTLRGFGVQVGANGNAAANRELGAIVYMAGKGDPFTAEAKLTMRDLIAEYRARGAGAKVVDHGSITGSECPGPAVRGWVRAGGYLVKQPVRKAGVVAKRPVRAARHVIRRRLHKGYWLTTVEQECCE